MISKLVLLIGLLIPLQAFADSPSTVQGYQNFLSELDLTKDPLDKALEKFKAIASSKDLALNDELFIEFKRFYGSYVRLIGKGLDLENDLIFSEDELGSSLEVIKKELKLYQKNKPMKFLQIDVGRSTFQSTRDYLKKYGIEINSCEEYLFVEEKDGFILKSFEDYVSPTMLKFLIIDEQEKAKQISPACEGFTDYVPKKKEYDERKRRVANFVKSFPNFIYIKKVKNYLDDYKDSYSKYLESVKE